QFHLVQRIRAEVVHKRRGGCDLRFVDAELLDDDLLYAFFYAGHSHSSAPTMPGLLFSFHTRRWSYARQNRRFSPLRAACPFYARPIARSTYAAIELQERSLQCSLCRSLASS